MLRCTPYQAINGLLIIDIAVIGANDDYAAFSVRVPREMLARNADILDTLSDLAAGFDIAPAPPPQRGNGDELLKVPFGYIGANEEFAVLSVRVPRKDLAEHHGFLATVAELAAGLTPVVPTSDT
jgi:hypothetical protein